MKLRIFSAQYALRLFLQSPRSYFRARLLRCLLLATILLCSTGSARAEITADQVREAMRLGVRYLQSRQSRVSGGWPERPIQPGGLSALCTLAMLECGEPVDSPSMQKALAYLRAIKEPASTYSSATMIMAFCAAEPEKDRLLIRTYAQWLEQAQITDGPLAGSWTYVSAPGRHTRGDNSNSQFALLGLHEAEQIGIEVSDATWQRALECWLSCQRPDGAWGYYKTLDGRMMVASTGSMTCAGTGAVVIAAGKRSAGDAAVRGNIVSCCRPQPKNDLAQRADDSAQRGLEWLASHFSVEMNPGPSGGMAASQSGLFYYLYGIERVGRLTGRRFIGRHDWYREGAEMLVRRQDRLSGFWEGKGHGEDNPLIATSFALLFLAKGRRPVVMAKLKHGLGEDWDWHRSGVHNLTRYVEKRWQQRLTWQSIDAKAATVADLLETPVLMLSGRDALALTAEQKQNLQDYVNQGGFLLAEANTGGREFDRTFRQLMKELFPDNSLRELPPEHPIWYAEQRVDPNHLRHLYGINACCRTSVVYCPSDLSCRWELHRAGRSTGYPPQVQEEIDACMAIGANILAYATGRRLKDKLDPKVENSAGGEGNPKHRGTLVVPKLLHAGGADEARNALPNLLRVISKQTDLRLKTDSPQLSPSDSRLLDYPIAFIHGRRNFRFREDERRALAAYLRRGGFLFGDAICANPQFATALRREIKAALPEAQFVQIPSDHALFQSQMGGYDLPLVSLRDPQVRSPGDPLQTKVERIKPLLEGVELEGRLAVVFSPYDISCAMENAASLECKGYLREDAARLATNIVLYALQQ